MFGLHWLHEREREVQTSDFAVSGWNSGNGRNSGSWGTAEISLAKREMYKTLFEYFLNKNCFLTCVNFHQKWYLNNLCQKIGEKEKKVERGGRRILEFKSSGAGKRRNKVPWDRWTRVYHTAKQRYLTFPCVDILLCLSCWFLTNSKVPRFRSWICQQGIIFFRNSILFYIFTRAGFVCSLLSSVIEWLLTLLTSNANLEQSHCHCCRMGVTRCSLFESWIFGLECILRMVKWVVIFLFKPLLMLVYWNVCHTRITFCNRCY